jgi:hypothetical protein
MTTACSHDSVACLNQHELIRKYRCAACGGVMMCGCDEAFGRRHLAHQLHEGCELETQERVPVTHGFRPLICSECRGLPADPAPAAAIHGRTSKIRRYYWRELFFAELDAMADWDEAHPCASETERVVARCAIEKRVVEEIRQLHATTPKYVFNDLSQAAVIARYEVEVEAIDAVYAAAGTKGAQIMLDSEVISPEAFATKHYEAIGWSALPLESLPLHALFGVFMWLLIQDPDDPRNRVVMFGNRTVYEAARRKEMIWTPLPEDFGTKGYGKRRVNAIEAHLSELPLDDLLWTFDYWRPLSEDLRQYLWAHRPADVDRARQLVEILPPETIIAILRYLVDCYWGRYLGWPDLLLHRGDEILFVEVKSSSDKLSEEQKSWIADNHDILHLPFRIAKLHKKSNRLTG